MKNEIDEKRKQMKNGCRTTTKNKLLDEKRKQTKKGTPI